VYHPADGIDADQHGQVVQHRDQPGALQGELDRITGAELPAELRRSDETGDGRDGREDQNMNGVTCRWCIHLCEWLPIRVSDSQTSPHMFRIIGFLPR
jgi:hypothetical protein